MALNDQHLIWYRSHNGIGDRIHHIVQMLEVAELVNARCVVDFRDGMFGALGEDAFSRWLICSHPLLIQAPNFDEILDNKMADLIPLERSYFAPYSSANRPFRILLASERIVKMLNLSIRYTGLSGRILRKINMVFLPRYIIDTTNNTPIAPMGYRIKWRKINRPTIHLYMDVIRKPNWTSNRMVWPHPDAIASITAEWPLMGIKLDDCGALHVRQTDKSASKQWRKWLDEIKQGKRFADQSQLFLATDSKHVLDAFKQAGLRQTLFFNPWLTLSDDEYPLHKVDHDGEWVMRTALFDLWTCANCAAFQPWKYSSFSRLISVWRKFL